MRTPLSERHGTSRPAVAKSLASLTVTCAVQVWAADLDDEAYTLLSLVQR